MRAGNTREEILRVAREIVAAEGLSGLSFDAIARRLGRSKQAVLYWYATKHELLAALFLPWLEAEAAEATRAVGEADRRGAAIAAFVHAVSAFHLGDLDRFRMMYLVPQTIPANPGGAQADALLSKVHPVTDRMYSALAEKLDTEGAAARREALAIHSAVLGLVLMFGLSDSIDDPLKHAAPDMTEALIARLTRGDLS